MKLSEDMLTLYAVTDSSWLNGKTLAYQVEEALSGGATAIQLREKGLSFVPFLQKALELKEICERYSVTFIINDNVEVTQACRADGIHIGQDDLDLARVREALGNDVIIGVSAQTVEQAKRAEAGGADYLGVGAVFSTATKLDADTVPIDVLREICASVSIPTVAIGGISGHNILKLKGTGIKGVAVVSAIFAEPDISGASRRLKKLSLETVNL